MRVSCVIVGRCSGFVLEDAARAMTADQDDRDDEQYWDTHLSALEHDLFDAGELAGGKARKMILYRDTVYNQHGGGVSL